MIQFSTALDRTPGSQTVAMTARVAALRHAGNSVINLGVGEPDFETPDFIKEAGIKAIRDGETFYTASNGLADLRAAIAHKLKTENQMDAHVDGVIVSSGAKQSIFNALLATLDPGDEVIIPAPYWVSYPSIVEFAGGTPVIAATHPKDDWVLQPDELRAKISDRTKWIILNSPGNPTGGVYPMEAMRALADVLTDHPDIWVMSDEIYEKIVFDQHRFTSFAQAAPDLANRTLTINGFSKSYAMTGWRIGYAAGAPELIRAMNKIQSQSTGNASAIAQHAAIAALTGPQDFFEPWNKSYQMRRDLIVQFARSAKLDLMEPKGAFYAFLKLPDLGVSPDEIAVHLLDKTGVAGVDGAAFGAPGYLRLSFAASKVDVEEGLERLSNYLSAPI